MGERVCISIQLHIFLVHKPSSVVLHKFYIMKLCKHIRIKSRQHRINSCYFYHMLMDNNSMVNGDIEINVMQLY